MKRLNGWQVRNRQSFAKFEKVPTIPTRWDRFCYANRIDDPLAALQNGKRTLIRDFVHKHHDNAFIPENVLESIGCSSRWES